LAFEGKDLRILVCEYVSGGGYAQTVYSFEYISRGYAMLRCVIADLEAAGHQVTVLLDGRISKANSPLDAHRIVPVTTSDEPQKSILDSIESTDAILIIAPETDQTLHKLVKTVEQTGKISLNCTSEAIASISGKADLCSWLEKNGYATPKTLLLSASDEVTGLKKP
jgi:predicted ATP-grasp superfamily ATP-dependent carboligase